MRLPLLRNSMTDILQTTLVLWINTLVFMPLTSVVSQSASDFRAGHSPFGPPVEDEYYSYSDIMKSNGESQSVSISAAAAAAPEPPEVSSQSDSESSEDLESPSISSYQNQIVAKPRPKKAGSQEAPPDATKGLLTKHPAGKPKKHIFCYYGSSANSRPSVGKFWPEHIDPFLCTHLIFAFVDITKDGTGIKPNNWNDLGEMGLYKRTLALKKKNPELKILLAVGGWKIGSKPFIPVMESEETWKTWVDNVVLYLRKFGFDGFDMDWEFPGWRGSGPQDRHKFTLLMRDLHGAFAEEAKVSGKPKLILTMATASSAFYIEKSYEQSEVHKYLDFMLLMTYNYHGSGWEKHTGHHSPLLPHPLDPPGEQRELFILWSLQYWLNFGVPREKIILGLPTYGLGWKLTDKSKTGVRAPADGGNTKGKYTEESGILSHYEICEHVLKDGWKVEWIEEQRVPYAYGQNEWIGFDSPDSFYLKALTVIKEGLAGVFIWSVEMDDFSGHCGGPKYPLLRTVYEVFTQSSSVANLKSLPKKSNAVLHTSSSVKTAAAAKGHSASSSSSKGGAAHNHNHNHDHSLEGESASHGEEVWSTDEHSYDDGSYREEEYGEGAWQDDWHDDEASHDGEVWSTDEHSYDDGSYREEEYGEQAWDHSSEAYSAESHDYDSGSDSSSYSYDDHETHIDCEAAGVGIHPDPVSCHHFFLCMPVSHHQLAATRMACPIGTLFDLHLQVCNHEHNVHCSR